MSSLRRCFGPFFDYFVSFGLVLHCCWCCFCSASAACICMAVLLYSRSIGVGVVMLVRSLSVLQMMHMQRSVDWLD